MHPTTCSSSTMRRSSRSRSCRSSGSGDPSLLNRQHTHAHADRQKSSKMLHSGRRLLQSAARRQCRLVSSSSPAPSSTPPSSAPSSSGIASALFSTPFNPSSSSSPPSSSAASASSSQTVHAPASLLGPRQAVVSFDTYKVSGNDLLSPPPPLHSSVPPSSFVVALPSAN